MTQEQADEIFKRNAEKLAEVLGANKQSKMYEGMVGLIAFAMDKAAKEVAEFQANEREGKR